MVLHEREVHTRIHSGCTPLNPQHSIHRTGYKGEHLLLFVCVLCSLMVYVAALRGSALHIDEREAIHTAWKIASGERIYVDFFQHHHALLYYLLAPVLNWFGDTINSLFASRVFIGCFGIGILYYTARIADLLFGHLAKYTSATLLAVSAVFLNSATDVRPDVPQVLCATASLFYTLRYLTSGSLKDLLLGAVLLGLAFLFLQKAIFMMFAVGLIWLVRWLQGIVSIRRFLVWSLIAGLVCSGAAIYHYIDDSFTQYYELNFLLNALPVSSGFFDFSQESLKSSLYRFRNVLGPLSLVFLTIALVPKLRAGVRGAYAGWFRLVNPSTRAVAELVGVTLFIGATTVGYSVQFDQYFLQFTVLVTVVVAGVLHLSSTHLRLLTSGTVVMVLTYSVLTWDFGTLKLDRQVDQIRYALAVSKRTDVVYDESMLLNLFRRDAHYFWFSTGPGQQISKYRRLRPMVFEMADVIDMNAPVLVHTARPPTVWDLPSGANYCKSAVSDKIYFVCDDRPQ